MISRHSFRASLAITTILLVAISLICFPYCVPNQAPTHGAQTLGGREGSVHLNLQVHAGYLLGKPLFATELSLALRHGLGSGQEAGLRLHGGLFGVLPMGFTLEYTAPIGLRIEERAALFHAEAGYHLVDFAHLVYATSSRASSDNAFNLFFASPSLILPLGESGHNTFYSAVYYNGSQFTPAFGDALGYANGSDHVREVFLHLMKDKQTLNLAF